MAYLKPYYSLGFILMAVILFSCETGVGPGKKDLHNQYAKKLKEAGLHVTALGRAWFAEADKSLTEPVIVSLPYKQVGYFAEDKPTAIGLQFKATRGEKLSFQLKRNPDTSFIIYADLWQQQNNEAPDFLLSVDTAESAFDYEVEETGNYMLRLQPELLGSGAYELSVTVSASLGFPSSTGTIQSFWGAARGSARKHEGIDIFASRGTPVVAADDGRVTRVGENNLGGKVVFMRVGGKNISLYYAHLDEQLVQAGQKVKKGDTLGLMGNSGNARTTLPHLHFGIYTSGGAIDPLPFVNPNTKRPGTVSYPSSRLNQFVRLTADQKLEEGITVKRNQLLFALAAGTDGLITQLPGGQKLRVPASSIRLAGEPISVKKLKGPVHLLANPVINAPAKKMVNTSATVNVLGYHGDYAFIKADETTGWISSSSL